jgi:hypothetical protein
MKEEMYAVRKELDAERERAALLAREKERAEKRWEAAV